jgi:quinol monooxygenase YgiN
MTALSVHAYVVARPDKVEEVRAAAQSIVTAVEAEDGCLDYHLLIDDEDERVIAWFERWRDEDAFAAHLEGPAAGRLGTAIEGCLAGPMVVRRYRDLHVPPQ